MTTIAQVSRRIAAGLGIAAGIAGAGALALLRRPLPQTTGQVPLPGLSGRAQVLRDRWGVPHIYAATNDDLFRALGYVHAQDRLWQMDLNRRTGYGQLAEIFGEIALSSDRYVRVLGFGRVARREVALLDDETRTLVEAYCNGINAFVAAHHRRLPIEFALLRYEPRPWEPADVMVWAKMMAQGLCTNWTTELFNAQVVAAVGAERASALLATYPDESPFAVPAGISYSTTIGEGALRAAAAAAPFLHDAGTPQGSNAWVVSGERSATGKPLLADDPHLGLNLPGIWHEVHLEGGDFHVAGASFPGTLGVVIGHNQRIAWGVTNSMLDVQDLYIERFDAANPLRYEWQGAWQEAESIRETIVVKGQATPTVQEVRITRHGPVITDIAAPAGTPLVPSETLALRWTALEPSPQLHRSVLAINRAYNWDTFRAALADWRVPGQNFVYVDVDGHYGYTATGDIPIRAQGDGRLPVPGWDGEHEWQGYIPAAAMPAAYDPSESFVLTANNRIAGPAYHYADALQGEWLNGYRAERIEALLRETKRHSTASFARIQRDLFSLPGHQLAQIVAGLHLSDPFEQQVRDQFTAWDGMLTSDAVGGTIYDALRHHIERQVYAELGPLIDAQAGLGTHAATPSSAVLSRRFPQILARIAAAPALDVPDPWLSGERTWGAVLRHSLQLAIVDLRLLGNDPATWTYGRVHALTLRHPLGGIAAFAPVFNRGPWPTGGDIDTVAQAYIPRQTPAGPIYNGVSCRLICDPIDWEQSRMILPGGQSGHPGSKHYSDMNAAWRTGGYHPMLWRRERVEAHTVATLTLEPAKRH